MDNKAFETTMFNAVNDNAKAASEARATQFLEDAMKWRERRKAERINALIEVICWMLGFIITLTVIGLFNYLGKLPNEYAIAITALVSLVTGGRVCVLAIKY